MIGWIDHVVAPVADLSAAAEPYERLGLVLTPVTRHAGAGTENRACFVGSGPDDFYLELLGVHDRAAAEAAGRASYLRAMADGRGVARLMLGTSDIGAAAARLAAKGVRAEVQEVRAEDGRKVCDAALVEAPALGMEVGLIQYPETREAQHARRAAAGRFAHGFPLVRMDHLAAVVHDLEAVTHAWDELLGVTVAGEVRGPGLIIRQMRIGGPVLELLGPDGPGSRMLQRPEGMASMVAWEVADLDAAVALARERGFSPSEPATGVLPGTRVATIPPAELAGVAMQLLQYVQRRRLRRFSGDCLRGG